MTPTKIQLKINVGIKNTPQVERFSEPLKCFFQEHKKENMKIWSNKEHR